MKKADAILTADWHLREDQPTCRKDIFWDSMWEKVAFVKDLQKKHGCPIYHSGDLFDYWKPSPALLSKAIEEMPDSFYTIYGNHDLPQHNLQLAYKSGLYCLAAAKAIQTLSNLGDWKYDEASLSPLYIKDRKVLILHTMTYQGEVPYPGCEDPKSTALLRKFKGADLIVTGHNHKPFVEERGGRLLVNPGSLSRQTASDTFEPRVYLYYADTNEVEPVKIPIKPDVVSREHIEKVKERDGRIDAFISTLQEDFTTSLDFESNLEQFMEKNDIATPVKEIIYHSIGR